MFPKNIIKKMRIEDLRTFYIENKEHMSSQEKRKFENSFFNKNQGYELLVERKGGKLSFTDFLEDDEN